MSAIPTYSWQLAPEGLATRRQLAAAGDTARDLENAAFVLPGVVVVEAQAKQ